MSSSWFGAGAAPEMSGAASKAGRCLGGRGTKGKFPALSCSSEQGLQQEGLLLVKQEGFEFLPSILLRCLSFLPIVLILSALTVAVSLPALPLEG